MYDSIRGIIYGLLRHQNNWCQYHGERALTGNGAKRHGCHFIPYPITLYWTHTRLNGNKGTLLLCWESYFSRPFIRRMSLSKATQVRAEAWLLGSWQCSRGCGRIQSTELLHITVPLPNMGLCRSLARRLLSSVFCTLYPHHHHHHNHTPTHPPQSRMKAQEIDARWLDVLT